MNPRRVTLLFSIPMILLALFAVTAASEDNGNKRHGAINVEFVTYAHNPVLALGTAGAWDDGTVNVGHVLYKDGLFHLFYNGKRNTTPAAIGYATSTDGFNFIKSDSNPILKGSGAGLDAFAANTGAPLVDGDAWILYYSARSVPGVGPGPAIGRATALSPIGPWSKDASPVLTVGSPGEWDSGWVAPNSVIKTDDGYVMYYTAGINFGVPPQLIGRATSPDGITWTKYHNPDMTTHPYAESTPVFLPGPPGSWDSRSVSFSSVLKTAYGWEMFYTGVSDVPTCCDHQVGYASSHDGIHWERYRDNPVLSLAMDPLGMTARYIEAPAVAVRGSVHFLYYDYGTRTYAPISGLGAALGTVTRCPELCDDEGKTCEEFSGDH
jgi:hypothetical protein